MKKLYWSEIDEERIYTKDHFINEMKELGLSELKIYETRKEKIPGVFYCSYHADFCDVSDPADNPCGKLNCDQYSPCNGKNGRCRYHDPYSNEATDKFIILKLKQEEKQ